ncbi:hypothetical protein JX266_005278 [Neoarthrinium moseri]|uniref:uncharacterized protein n=1 Tax=Neoarthrinium moseri TaxID=1658444 RepID=UPI001FDC9CB6|nr:uncharacterized protein JN550_007354 [Neoarthrinium moseri]KAI1848850.1 hypothetical protein JX266_005278 [Neoarthrinium moseri]KAI1866807.1 hypothetical protein JN550_007354 [Neoarthrinium moseri]
MYQCQNILLSWPAGLESGTCRSRWVAFAGPIRAGRSSSDGTRTFGYHHARVQTGTYESRADFCNSDPEKSEFLPTPPRSIWPRLAHHDNDRCGDHQRQVGPALELHPWAPRSSLPFTVFCPHCESHAPAFSADELKTVASLNPGEEASYVFLAVDRGEEEFDLPVSETLHDLAGKRGSDLLQDPGMPRRSVAWIRPDNLI